MWGGGQGRGGQRGGGGGGTGRADPAAEAPRDAGKSRASLVHPEGARGAEDRHARPRDVPPANGTGEFRTWVGVDASDEEQAQEKLEGGEKCERSAKATPTEQRAGPSATTDPRRKPEGSRRLETLAGVLTAVWP